MTEIKRDIVRDLMRVAYAWADEPVCPVSGRSGALEIAIRDALRAALAKSQPVEQGEPYAYANGFGDLFKNRDEIEGVATELFTHPVRPMSDEQIAQWMPVGLLRTEEFVYQKGIKDAEKFHGIKGATE